MTWKVAPSYQSAEIKKIDPETRKAYIIDKCDRCGGLGIIVAYVENGHPVPIPVDGGVCYKCNGTGKISKWVKAYTEEEYDKYVASQQRAKEKKINAETARKQDLIDNSEKNKAVALTELGYDPENPLIWIVIGDNTYAIKDELKAMGCKFNPNFGWYNSHPVDVPDNYGIISINFDDVYDWNCFWKKFTIKDNAKEVADAVISAHMPKSNSEYIGEVKERIRDLQVTLTGFRTTEGFYGTTYIYSFLLNDKDVLTWFSSSCKEVEVGDALTLTGTVKDHKEYKGVKQTILTRCIIKERSV